MNLVKESINFERGQDPMSAMNIGVAAENYAQLMLDMEQDLWYKKNDHKLPKRTTSYFSKNYKDWLDYTDAIWGKIRKEFDVADNLLTDADIYKLIYKHYREKAVEFKEHLTNLLILKESFERGQDPIKAMGIGQKYYIRLTLQFFETLKNEYSARPLGFPKWCFYLLDSDNNKIGVAYHKGGDNILYAYFSDINNIIQSKEDPKENEQRIPREDFNFIPE